VSHLNICGWTRENCALRENIIIALDSDIISLSETHLGEQNGIYINGYTWFGFNRVNIHRNAPKPSGGVGLLVKHWIITEYDINVVDKSYDGILVVQLIHKQNNYDFTVFSCYLPPENSTRGRDAQGFFSHLLAQIYINSESDTIIIAADFNSRVWSL